METTLVNQAVTNGSPEEVLPPLRTVRTESTMAVDGDDRPPARAESNTPPEETLLDLPSEPTRRSGRLSLSAVGTFFRNRRRRPPQEAPSQQAPSPSTIQFTPTPYPSRPSSPVPSLPFPPTPGSTHTGKLAGSLLDPQPPTQPLQRRNAQRLPREKEDGWEADSPLIHPIPLAAMPNPGYVPRPNAEGLRLMGIDADVRSPEAEGGQTQNPMPGYFTGDAIDSPDRTIREQEAWRPTGQFQQTAVGAEARPGGDVRGVLAPGIVEMKSGWAFKFAVSDLLFPILNRARLRHASLRRSTKRFTILRTISLVLQLLIGALVIAHAAHSVDTSSQMRVSRFLVIMTVLGGINILLTGFMIWYWGCREPHVAVKVKMSTCVSYLITLSLILQFLDGILVIAFSALSSSSPAFLIPGSNFKTCLCALGEIELLLSGTLLWIWASGEPCSGLLRARELEKFILNCEHTITDSGHDRLIADSYSGLDHDAVSTTMRHAEFLNMVETLRKDYDMLIGQGKSCYSTDPGIASFSTRQTGDASFLPPGLNL